MHAEQAYAFSHTLLRDAAYQLQLPEDRAQLHALALRCFEDWLGVPELPRISDAESNDQPHASDPFAAELAEHAARGEESALKSTKQGLYLLRAGLFARRHDDSGLAMSAFLKAASCDGLEPHMQRRARLYAINEMVLCGMLEEAERHIMMLRDIAREAGDVASEFRTEHALAGIHWNRGRMDQAEEVLRRALSLAARSGRSDLASECRGGLGVLLCDSGRAGAALEHLIAAVEHFRATRANVRVALNLGNLALCYSRLNDFDAARRYYEEALAIAQGEGARRREGMLQCGIADLFRKRGRPELAEPHYLAALKLLSETGDQRGEVIALNNYANLLAGGSRHADATKFRERAYELALEMGNPLLEQVALMGLAKTSSNAGRHEEAVARYRRSLDISRALGHTYREAASSCDLADSLLALNRFDEARALALRVLELCDSGVVGDERFKALVCLARIEEAEGHLGKAENWILDALALPPTLETRLGAELARLFLARIQVRLGKLESARAHWRQGIRQLALIAPPEVVKTHTDEMRTTCKAEGVAPLDEH